MAAVDEIKSQLDILDVVSQYAHLQRSGRSYKALCPFHSEKTPSFFVFPERQSWRCFGACAIGGDVFSFFMRIENLDFGEALRRLARQIGVELADKRGEKGREDALSSILEAAREYFCRLLANSGGRSAVAAYLQKRGLTRDTVDRFQLGLSPPDSESLKDHLASQEYNQEQLALAGLITRGQDNTYRDLFRRRLMFPIRDAAGRLAGFGGRVLDDSNPKYLNSPKSPIFDKSNIFYGLHLSKDSIRERGIVIVEGYMDVIVAHQYGFSNVVASMGTALTQQQVSLVRGLTRGTTSTASGDVVLALDPDAAGQEATLRSLESSWEVFQRRSVGRTRGDALYERPEISALKVAALPQGKDPDEIILDSPEEWNRLVDDAVPLMDYLFTALSKRLVLSTPEGKAKLAELLFPLIAAMPDPFQQDHYFQHLANLLGVSEATLQASLGRRKPERKSYRDNTARSRGGKGNQTARSIPPGQEAATTPFARLDHDPLEEHCLALLLQIPNIMGPRQTHRAEDGGTTEQVVDITDEDGKSAWDLRLGYFQRLENREVFTNWTRCSTLDVLKESLDEEIKEHLDYLLTKRLPPSDRNQSGADLKYCVRRLEERYLRGLNREEELRLSQAAPEDREEQERRLIQLNKRLNHVFRD